MRSIWPRALSGGGSVHRNTLGKLFNPTTVIGVFKQRNGLRFNLRLRNGLPALQLSYVLTQLIGPQLRELNAPERIFVHNPKPHPKGKGKGQNPVGKGKGKEGIGNESKGRGGRPGRERSPRGLAPAQAAAIFSTARAAASAAWPQLSKVNDGATGVGLIH